MHVYQKYIRKSQAKAIVQAFKRQYHTTKNREWLKFSHKIKQFQKQLDMQRQSKDTSSQNNQQLILQK